MQFINGNIVFDELKYGDRTWQIVIESDFNIDEEDLKSNMPAYIYTVYGQTTKTISEKTQVYGKNIGRSNETSNLEQAVKQALSLINKKKKSGYNTEINLYPMAVSAFDPKKIKFPMAAQPKLDGVRMIATDKDLLSRRLHEINGFAHIKLETDKLLEALGCIFIDGELYLHGKSLQDISGIVRGSDLNEKKSLEYHIFDICTVEKLGFVERYNLLESVFSQFEFKYLKLVKSELLNNQEEADDYFNDLISKNYEGIIYKQITAPYEASSVREKRSTKYVKRKASIDCEFKITGYTSGVGKYAGAVVFILETKEGNTFNCVPIGSMEYRKKLYDECVEDFDKFYEKLATVKFDAWSNNDIPLRGVIINIDRID